MVRRKAMMNKVCFSHGQESGPWGTKIRAMADVCLGAEKYHVPRMRSNQRVADQFARVDEAIAMAAMYTANHLSVSAIIALTESGSTARWMSRVRSDIAIYALTPHEATSRRVTLYRGVYPVEFEIDVTKPRQLYRDIFSTLTRSQTTRTRLPQTNPVRVPGLLHLRSPFTASNHLLFSACIFFARFSQRATRRPGPRNATRPSTLIWMKPATSRPRKLWMQTQEALPTKIRRKTIPAGQWG